MTRRASPGRPLSVVVLGNSLTVLSVPPRTGPDDGLYAEVLRDRLVDAGVPTRVVLEGRWFDFAKDALRRYEPAVRRHLPDVLVLHYGLNESQPWLVPVPLVRHLITTHRVATRSGRAYRAKVAEPVWATVRAYRRWASSQVGTRTWQTTPDRFAGTMTQLVRVARSDLLPLVLIVDVDPPGALLEHFLPGMAARHAVVQGVLRRVVDSFGDPEVRLVPSSQITAVEGATYDGMHYSPLGHRLLGEALADEVLRWLGPERGSRGGPPSRG